MENPFEIIDARLTRIEALLEKILAAQEAQATKEIENTRIISLKQAAEIYPISEAYLYKKTSQREIPHSKQGGKIFFEVAKLEEYLLQNSQKTVKEMVANYQNNRKQVCYS